MKSSFFLNFFQVRKPCSRTDSGFLRKQNNLSCCWMTERIQEQANLLVSTVSLQSSLERRRREIAEHRANLAATTRAADAPSIASPVPVPTYGASRIQAFLQSTQQMSTVHASIGESLHTSHHQRTLR